MKNFLRFFLFSFVLFSCKTDDLKHNKLITDKIQYDVSIKNTETDMDWWIQNIEGPKKDKFTSLIFDAVKDNKLKIYDLNEREVTLENVLSNLFTFDTIHLQKNGIKNQTIDTIFITNSFCLNNINKFRFREKWIFNEKSLMVTKQVDGFCPFLVTEISNNQPPIALPLFWVFPDTTQKAEENNLFQITPKIQYDVTIRSDNAKNEWYADNIETSDREYFLNKIIEVASKGKLKVVDFFDKPLDKKQFNALLHRKDTVLIENPEDPGSFSSKVVNVDFDSRDIKKIRFIEEWKIDTKTFQLYKTVKAIGVVVEDREDNGNVRGYMPVFYIYFDESIKNVANN